MFPLHSEFNFPDQDLSLDDLVTFVRDFLELGEKKKKPGSASPLKETLHPTLCKHETLCKLYYTT